MPEIIIRYCKRWASYKPKAARAAAAIQNQLGVHAQITEGDRGEWRVLVDGREVARKGWIMFPSDQKVVDAVRAALNPPG